MTLRVAHLTDIHLTENSDTDLYGVDTTATLKQAISEVRQLSKTPDVIIITGDLAETGTRTSYDRLGTLLPELEVPVYILQGNHDDDSNMQPLQDIEGITMTKSARMHGWGFLFVNSQVENQAHGFVDAAEMAQLEKNLASFDKMPVLVAIHHTPTVVCPAPGCQLQNSKEFTALLNRHENVKAVIAGHTHYVHVASAGNHKQFTSPSTFAQVEHPNPEDAVDPTDFAASHHLDISRQGFRILDLAPDGVIESTVHWTSAN